MNQDQFEDWLIIQYGPTLCYEAIECMLIMTIEVKELYELRGEPIGFEQAHVLYNQFFELAPVG